MQAPDLATGFTAQAVVFEGALEGIHRSFGPRLTPELLDVVKQIGVDFDHLLPAYPLTVWEEVIRIVSASLYPSLSPEQQWERMGFEWIAGYLQTMLGRAALAIGKVIGPRRTLERMGRNFRTAGNYAHFEAIAHGPCDLELVTSMIEPFRTQWANRPSVIPHYRVGVLRGTLHALDVEASAVEILHHDPAIQETRFRVRW